MVLKRFHSTTPSDLVTILSTLINLFYHCEKSNKDQLWHESFFYLRASFIVALFSYALFCIRARLVQAYRKWEKKRTDCMKLFETSWIYVENKQQEIVLHSTYFVQVFDSFSPHSSRSKKENHICDIKNSNSRSSAKPYPLWRCFICKANMPPKNSINGFALFMNDQRDVLKRQGANCGGQALAMTCGPLWKVSRTGVKVHSFYLFNSCMLCWKVC